MKDDTHHPLIPHSEWFCTYLAELVGIPTIECRILEMPPDASGVSKRSFGSRWQPGEIPHSPAPWWVRVQQHSIPVSHVATVLSWIYAFDHFINNVDRHQKNFFAQKSHDGIAIFAVDYSKAWLWGKFPPPPLPFNLNDPHQRTVLAQRDFTSRWGAWIVNSEVTSVLARLSKVTKQDISYILQIEPKEWLSQSRGRAIMKWWGSKKFKERISQIHTGITNGTSGYL
jgi:hypothetical protein